MQKLNVPQNKHQISLTALNRQTADVLNRTIYGRQTYEVTRFGKVVAVITPADETPEKKPEAE